MCNLKEEIPQELNDLQNSSSGVNNLGKHKQSHETDIYNRKTIQLEAGIVTNAALKKSSYFLLAVTAKDHTLVQDQATALESALLPFCSQLRNMTSLRTYLIVNSNPRAGQVATINIIVSIQSVKPKPGFQCPGTMQQ